MSQGKKQRSVADALRLAATLAAIVLLLWWIGPQQLAAAFTDVVWIWLVVRIVPYAAGLWIQAWRWRLFLSLEGIETDTKRLFRRIWMSRFFAHFLPGNIGGDIFRVAGSGDFSNSKLAVARSVLLDRVVGLCSLVFYASLAATLWAWSSGRTELALMAALTLTGAAVSLALLATPVPGKILQWFAGILRPGKVQDFFARLAESLHDLGGQNGVLIKGALASVAYNVTWATSSYFGFLALNVDISLLIVVTVLPVVFLANMLPISINGIGVSEGIFVVVFTACGMTPAEAAAVAILLRVTGTVLAAFGGLMYVAERRHMDRAKLLRVGPR